MTFVSVLALGFGFLLFISALEDVSLVQTYRDILAGKSLTDITKGAFSNPGAQAPTSNAPAASGGGSSGTF